ncbi:TPR-like protein, partial [Stipitochalara longipes BDJ]
MNALKRGPVSTFKELESNVVTKAPVALDIIFVHGLGTKGAADIRRRLKTWLREIPKAEGLLGCRVWRFGFDGKELLIEGRPRLMDLARNLLKEIQRMPGSPTSQPKPEPAKSDRKLVFIGYGAAGWVIQEALAWYSETSTEAARRTAMVILLNLEHMRSKEALKMYLERFPAPLNPGKDKANLEFSLVEIIQKNFKQLVDSSFGPREGRITILDPNANPSLASTTTNNLTVDVSIQNEPVLRRETSDTHHTTDSTGSNTTDSSKDSSASSTMAKVEPLPLWEIKAGDVADGAVRSLLRTALTVEKSDDNMMAPSHNQPEYEPIAPTYGRFEASRFGIRKVSTGLSNKSSKFYWQIRSPPTPPDEIDDPIPKTVVSEQQAVVEGSQAVENIRKYLETTSQLDTISTPEVYVEYKPEKTDITTRENHVVAASEAQGIEQDLYTEVDTKPKDSPTSNPSAADPRQLLTLASLYQQSGELQKSQALYQRLVKLPSMEKGIDIIMTQIAITWIYEGHVKKAHKAFSDLEPRVEGPQRTWEVKRWLAITLDMQGLYEKGRQKLMNISGAFTSFQRAQQLTDVGLLARSTLALLFGHLGKYEEALARSKEVLRLAEQAVEEAKEGDPASMTRHRGALGSIQFDRAKILTYVGRYEEAEALNNQALENIQRNVGSKHVSTLECWSLKARHLASTCRLPQAEEQCQKTLKIMRKEIGKEHPSTLKTLGVLVFVYRLQARFTEALDTAKYLFEKCKASEAFGEDHPETINSMWQLAEVYLARGDFSNALHYQGQVVHLADKVLGKVHPTVVNYRACLAKVYCNRGNWTHSASLCFDVLDSYVSIISESFNARAILFDDSDDFETLNLSIASTIQCLGVTERERQHGNLEIAQELQTKAHEYMERTLGDDHADTLSSRWDLALTKLKRGQDGALQELAVVTASRRRVLGEDHPDTLAARHQLSVEKFNTLGDMKELDEQAEVLRLCIHLLGDDHPTTNLARIDLSNGYHSVGMLTDAEQLRLKALKVQLKTL